MTAASHGRIVARARASVVALAIGIVSAAAPGGVLETFDPAASINFSAAVAAPPVLADGPDDLSLVFWIRVPGSWVDDARILTAGDISVEFDGSAHAVRVRMGGTPHVLLASAPLGPLPVGGSWLLVACTLDAAAGTLDLWVRSPGELTHGADAIPGWTGGAAWPVTIGAAGGMSAFAGHLGLVVIRAGLLGEGDVTTLWRNGAPHYFSAALDTTGSLNGLEGVQWMIGHGIATDPRSTINPDAGSAVIDGPVRANNVLEYSVGHGEDTHYFMAADVHTISGEWTHRALHDETAPWSGFFERELPDLVLPEPAHVARESPLARRLANDEPEGLIRVIASANSRAARPNRSYAALENWGHGGLLLARRESLAGVIVPVWRETCVSWPAFECTARREGDVQDSAYTPYASVAFGSFGSHGVEVNPNYPNYPLVGLAVVIEDGATYVPKAKPVAGTLFWSERQPLTVRAMTLRFPGAGDVVSQGEKAVAQAAAGTVVGAPVTESLDTTVATHVMTSRDAMMPGGATILLAEPIDAIEVGHACYVGRGPGVGGISMVVDVRVDEATMAITLERPLPIAPAASSVLHFGPVTPHWVEHAWPGLAPTDVETFRGVRMTASGAPVVVLFLECFNPVVDGFIVGAVGKSGQGYGVQLDRLFSENGVPYMAGLEADVWLQFFAHQGSKATSMSAYTEHIQAASPETEIWWCGDPDLDLDGDSTIIDQWHSYIFGEAAAAGVGAIDAHNHPSIGTGNERALDGQSANRGHLSGRGNATYMAAVLEMLREAALPVVPVCTADFNDDGAVTVLDLAILIGAWGTDDPEIDIAPPGGDGTIDVLDVAALIGQWGACP